MSNLASRRGYPGMHEISVAEGIVELVEEKARAQRACSITLIKLLLGEFTTIVREALEFAFEIVCKGTLAEHAQLEIEFVPMIVRCVVCDANTKPIGGLCLICATCGFPMEIVSGEDLRIEYIEIETEEERLQWNEYLSKQMS